MIYQPGRGTRMVPRPHDESTPQNRFSFKYQLNQSCFRANANSLP